MNDPWLVLDCTYLCYRSYHAMGDLAIEGIKTGVTYGILRDILQLQRRFETKKIAFCFDYGLGLRKKSDAEYKANRKEENPTPQSIQANKEFQQQVIDLWTKHLPRIGFRNIFVQEGYEADDLIAKICNSLFVDEPAVIVSADKDLFQCLSDKVSFWNPQQKKLSSIESFKKEYGIDPNRWAMVKAIAGCSSDNVIGVAGVGEKTAIRYLLGTLGTHTVAYKKIAAFPDRYLQRNLRLVELPFHDTKEIKFKDDCVTNTKWKHATRALGIRSLRGLQ